MITLNEHESLLVMASILATVFCFNLALYFGYHKRKAYLFFAFYCLFHIFKIYLKSYPDEERLVPWLPIDASAYVYLSVLLGMVSMHIFLLYHFVLPHRKYVISGLMAVCLISFFLLDEGVYIYIGLSIALFETLWARKSGKDIRILLPGVAGFSLFVLLRTLGYMPYGYFIGIIFFVFCMLLSVGVELARQNREYRQALLRSSRLENQLLKKSIQPHFLFNSMTSLQELIETDPVKASHFVDDLSGEFELFSKISDKKRITIKEELQLIRHYLGIMTVRKNMKFYLDASGLDETEQIPPGVFLTLVENGITHGYEGGETGNFRITRIRGKTWLQYEVFNNGTGRGKLSGSGMGWQYIISRLEESYGKNFDFNASPCPGGWLATIKIFL